MGSETWPDLFIAIFASLVLVGIPGLILALAVAG
jgi:hypothetical protein